MERGEARRGEARRGEARRGEARRGEARRGEERREERRGEEREERSISTVPQYHGTVQYNPAQPSTMCTDVIALL